MVIPIGAGAGDRFGLESEEVPDVVRNYHLTWWWVALYLLLILVALEAVAGLIFSALFMGVIAYCIWYMVRDSCKDMSSYCLLLLCIMTGLQSIFDVIILCSKLGGRRDQKVHKTKYDPKTGNAEYNVRIEYSPFFDEASGWQYNLQSFCWLTSPMILIFIATLAYFSHKAYPSDASEDSPGEARPLLGPGFGGGLGRRNGQRANTGFTGPTGSRNTPPPEFVPFGGVGQQIGSHP